MNGQTHAETLGNYRLLQKIGEGGMGAVYLAEHVHLGRKAAVKLLLPEHSQNQDLVGRFFNEAKLAASLNHPGIVEVFDFGYDGQGAAYLVMEYLEGESLSKRLEREGKLSLPEAVELARQIALVVQAAHEKGIVHRDLKTDNVMLTTPVPGATGGGFSVKILDFGIAKLLDSTLSGAHGKATSAGMILGTPLFMAPEQCRGAGLVDHRADIYSLGCILYLLLTGVPPFQHEGVGELLAAHLHVPAPRPSALRPEVPPWLDAIVLAALHKDPGGRPQTMSAFAAALETGRRSGVLAAGRTDGAPVSALPQDTHRAASTGRLASGALIERTAIAEAHVPTFRGPSAPTPPADTGAATAPGTPRRGRGFGLLALGLVAGLAVAGAAVALRPRAPVAPTTNETPPPEPKTAEPAAVVTPPVAEDPKDEPTSKPGPEPEEKPAEPTPDEPKTEPERPKAEPTIAKKGDERAPRPHAKDHAARAPGPRTDREANDLYQRGSAALREGRNIEAIHAFRSYLERTEGDSPERNDVSLQLSKLQNRFAELKVTCDVAGARVMVNDVWVGKTPLADTILLMPGSHVLTVLAAGYQPFRRSLSVRGGQPMMTVNARVVR